MIILDTNIISEFMIAKPSPIVLNWLDDQSKHNLYVTSITLAEIQLGIQVLPQGKRKIDLSKKFTQLIDFLFDQRVLSFDKRAANAYASLMADRRKIGRPMSNFDGQIAAIAVINNCAIATRNIKDFEECNLELSNPFNHTS
ncbi:MAG: VapC toxin family PIN domain ribonuclease [Kangiella sp.]|nr:MAG: VapC toxin family PIN domain ribonuclease [Kangiella sp.]